MCFRLLFALCVGMGISSSQVHAQFTVAGEASEMPNSVFENTFGALSESNLLVPQGNFETFGVDFGAEGDTELTIVWKAPAGQHIQIEAPAGYSEVRVEFIYQLDATLGGAVGFDPSEMGFRSHTGGVPDNSALVSSQLSSGANSGARVSVSVFFAPGETTTFESFEVTIPVPASYDTDYPDVNVLQFSILGTASEVVSYSGEGALSDPGNWVTLVSAPTVDNAPFARKASLTRKAKKIKRQLKKAKRQKSRKEIGKAVKQLRKVNRMIRAIQLPKRPTAFLPVEQVTF